MSNRSQIQTSDALNETQLMLLRLFSRKMDETETNEIRDLLINHLNQKLQRELDIVISEKGYTQKDFDEILNNSQRTPKQ
ncbi:MAG: hypothetical protein MUF45_09220 [Spirosomaceae bacterium]|jgi:hypothetical protein|nr:hypothetical protein [Spirosomataceae bacterium]